MMIVQRPPRVPRELRRIAGDRDPVTVLVEVIGRHPTFAGAADELGVSELTLRRWRRRMGVQVAS